MRGDFSRSTFSTRMRYGSVTLQEGRVQLDTDWNEKSELQINGGLVYLDVWERDVRGVEDGALANVALSGVDTGSRRADAASESYGIRMVREVALDGRVSSTLHASLGRAKAVAGDCFPLPELEVSVEGLIWKRVASLAGSGPRDQVYVVTNEPASSSIVFGDGKHGARPDPGSRVVASYRFGGGTNQKVRKRTPKSKPKPA
jgi:hypothetical protein